MRSLNVMKLILRYRPYAVNKKNWRIRILAQANAPVHWRNYILARAPLFLKYQKKKILFDRRLQPNLVVSLLTLVKTTLVSSTYVDMYKNFI